MCNKKEVVIAILLYYVKMYTSNNIFGIKP